MKISNKILVAVLGLSLVLAVAPSASALTAVSFSPSTVTVKQGERFDVNLLFASEGGFSRARLELEFRPDVLSVVSFDPGVEVSTTTDAADTVDNERGIIIRTIRINAPSATSTDFGRITFLAKSSGVSTLVVNPGSSASRDGNGVSLDNEAVFTAFVINPNAGASSSGASGSVAGSQTTSKSGTAAKKSTTVSRGGSSGTMVLETPGRTLTLGDEDNRDIMGESTTTLEAATTTPEEDDEVAGAADTGGGRWIGIGIGLLVLLALIAIVGALSRRTV